MKTSVGTLVLLGAVMTAGLALARTLPPPRGVQAAPAPGPACAPDPAGGARRSTNAAATPVNGVGGQGGGRLSNRDHIDQDADTDIRTRRSAPASPTAPGATGLATGGAYTTGDFAGPELRRAGDPRGPGADSPAPAPTGNTYTTGDFTRPELVRAGDPRGPGADSPAPAAPACEPAPAVRR